MKFPLLCALLAGLLSVSATAAREKPNVILIVADDLGYADVGFNGAKDIPTPHLDALAKDGVRCTSGYVTASVCSPSRAGFLTGRMQQRFGHELNPKPDEPRAALPADPPTLPAMLAKAGYATGGIGKWHLGDTPGAHPLDRGFTDWFGFLGGGHGYFPGKTANDEYSRAILRGREEAPLKPGEYLTDVLTRGAVDFIERHREKPFFLYLAYNAPHTPLQVTPKYLKRVAGIAEEKRRKYAAMVCSVDDGVGAVAAKLREHGIEKDTLVVFFSDNGGPIAPNGSDNGALRGKKGTHYEGGVRVPFVVSWPGTLAAGEFAPAVSTLDLLPTAAALAGLPAPAFAEGVNLLPLLKGERAAAPRETPLFWRSRGAHAARMGQWKWIRNGNATEELYDLATDLAESKNIIAERADIAEQIRAAFAKWDEKNIPPPYPGLSEKVK